MKLRIKIILLMLFVVLSSSFSVLYTVTHKYYEDTLDKVYENHTYTALNISQQLRQYVGKLKLLHKNLDSNRLKEIFPEVIHVVSINDSKIKHLYKKNSELKSKYYTQILQKSFKPIFSIGEYICFSLFYEEENHVYMIDANFIKNLGQRGQAVGIGIFDLQDFTVLNIGNDSFNFIAPEKKMLGHIVKSETVSSKVVDLKNGKMLMAFAAIDSTRQSYVLVEAMQTQITELVISALKNIFILMFILLAVFIFLGIAVVNSMVSPIEILTEATKKISKGIWDLNIKVTSSDEVGKLTKSFLDMGQQLEIREEKIKTINNKLIQSEKLASLGLFSAGIAHEVKNPLGAILGNAQLIKRKSMDEDIVRYSDVIIDESYRANNIVQDLLVFAKERPLIIVNVNCLEFIKKIEGIFYSVCQENNIEFNISSLVEEFDFDPDQMIQVIENIGFNAIDAILESERTKRKLTINFERVINKLEIQITDNGIGMTDDVKQNIFEPFFSTKKIKKGTGLGMAICFGIVEKHQGEILISSTLGVGSEFKIRI